jgi:hypothetical protein
MYLQKEKLQHINSIAHEGKVVVFGTDADGKIWYTIKQDGFEDSYLNTPAEQRTGWENWQQLQLPDEKVDDQSVIEKEKAELTYQEDTSKYILRSRYQTQNEVAAAPVQLVSALGHIYVFRQSKSNTLLVDRFVLDGMTNKLNRKLEVRFKRSKQKHTPTKNTNKGTNGLVNIDSLDFRDANGNFFYEPTTEMCSVNNLEKGWFSVVLVPTIENDVYRWHIFAYNSQTQKVELTTIRASQEGLFDVKDYTIFEQSNETLVARQIPGVIKRTLDISGAVVTNGLSATKYDLQQEQQTQSGEMQLIKTATKLLLAIPTDKGTAAFSFAIAGDGTLAQIDDTPQNTILRSTQREILLPLNTLDEIKAIGDRTPPPQGVIAGLAVGTDEEDAEDLVKISTQGAAGLENYDLVKISGTSDYQGIYRAKTVDKNTFEIDLASSNGLGYWEKEDQEAGGLIFDGMITAYQKTADGKLRVTCENHGLENGDEVQIAGTDSYNNTYPVQKIDDTQFVIERKWATGEAINVKLASRKRRGVVFDGVNDYVEIPKHSNPTDSITVSLWAKSDTPNWNNHGVFVSKREAYILHPNEGSKQLNFYIFSSGEPGVASFVPDIDIMQWHHYAGTFDGKTIRVYIDGVEVADTKHDGKINADTGVMCIGRDDGLSRYFNGQIADVQIWKTARTAEEIKNNMYLQLTGKEVGLVGYWRLGAIAEGKVIDFSANCNDGIVYGDPYVSAATLNRKLAGATDAVKYSNPELFAVSEGATYEESFEFKVNPNAQTTVDLAYLDNADGKGIGNKIFTFAYWGKTSRSAEEKKSISAVQNNFEYLDNGWFRASCNVTIPDEVSLLRSFEIDKIQGNWVSLEISKHRIRLLSDSITEAKYTDDVTLATLADNQTALAAKLNQQELKEGQEGVLLKEKRELEAKIAAYNAQADTRARIEKLNAEIATLTNEEQALLKEYNTEQNNPFSYFCWLQVIVGSSSWKRVQVFNQSDNDNVSLVRHSVGAHIFWFSNVGNNTYNVSVQVGNSWKGVHVLNQSDNDNVSLVRHSGAGNLFSFSNVGNNTYNVSVQVGNSWKGVHVLNQSDNDNVSLVRCSGAGNLLKLEQSSERSNYNAGILYYAWQSKIQQLKQAQDELKLLNSSLTATSADKAAWDARLTQLIKEITAIQSEINILNATFLEAVKNAQAKPQTMPQVAKDGKGLVTQGALLGFVNSASRLNAIETCEGNVQLSYFDIQGRMRQTNYDATADSNNAAFEQWIPDAQRACLNFDNSNSVVKLDQPLYLPSDWTIEAWFFYPLPEAGEWNTLTRGKNADHHILVRNRKQLGIYLNKDSLKQNFYDSGFNMELLSQGWHHLAAVGGKDTTRFYIDGKKVGDTKAKALADAQDNLKKTPNDAVAQKKVDDIKKASLKVSSDVFAIGNFQDGTQQFGKVAEVRIWGVVLSDEEIAVNSKTLLSGYEPGLLAYYPMNEATGTEVRDQTGNGKNGTMEGANWWGCTAPIGNPGSTVMQFDGVDDHITLPNMNHDFSQGFTVEAWVWYDNFKNWSRIIDFGNGSAVDNILLTNEYASNNLLLVAYLGSTEQRVGASGVLELRKWIHLAATIDASGNANLYKNGQQIQSGRTNLPQSNQRTKNYIARSNWPADSNFNGKISDLRVWKTARTQAEIQADMYKRLSGKELNLVAYFPLNEIQLEGSTRKVLDLAGNNYGIVTGAITVDDNTLPIGGDALVSNEYSTITLENTRKVAVMRRFFASPTTNGATLLPDKRIEALELKWIGNAQFAPTLLGYIEGPPPVPSENLTLNDDYNGATSVELTMSEDVAFSWNRSQDYGLGATIDTFIGADTEAHAGFGATAKIAVGRAGFKGNFDFSYQFQNDSSITSSLSLSMTDKLELRGTPEETAKFPHLGKRFIPKNIGYALVVSAIADVFVTRLARSGKMVGYQVQPVDGIPPDVNTITFLINPAYTMNGSLDGMTGSSATSHRFFKHVPEMRSQYGSLYPVSYYRLQEAYDLKRQIEAEDKRRESYFSNFDVRLVDETSLNRNIDSGHAPTTVGVQREEDKPDTPRTEEKLKNEKAEAAAKTKQQETASQQKQAEIQSKIGDPEKRVQATDSFAGWQKRMESLQIRAGKRNIVNTYVWDADGGLRTEAQSFANTVEHTIGGSFNMNAGLGFEGRFGAGGFNAELTAQATVNLTQTMSKTEARSKGFELNVDLGGLEYKGITNYNDNPILPGEKVDRYRFMSFYLEGSTQHFQDFFNYVVDPEWLASNDEEARALRQTQAGKPNKTWRVLHRVTYVERPALMGFGRDVRKLRAAAEISENQQLLGKIAKLEESNRKLEEKLDKILDALKAQK